MSRQEALVTPSVMKWAREKAGYDISTVSAKIGRPELEIQAWETGRLHPTIAQARRASEVYKRSLAVFYLPVPPRDFDTLRDFRHLPASIPQSYSPELALLIRRVQKRQEWMREWLKFEGTRPLKFVGSADLKTKTQKIAFSIRQILGIAVKDQMACTSRREALNLWIKKTEEAGIYVCREGAILCTEARGFVLTDVHAPFIYLNTDDAKVAQIFTLLHELAHLWINSPGLSNLEGVEKHNKTEEDRIEIFCNQVAAETLLDQQLFEALWNALDHKLQMEKRIERISNNVKISEEVVARRLLQRGMISLRNYQLLRKSYADRWKDFREKELAKRRSRQGGPSPHRSKVDSNGKRYTQTVLSAYYGGNISGRDASGLLGVKVNYMPKVAQYAGIIISSK